MNYLKIIEVKNKDCLSLDEKSIKKILEDMVKECYENQEFDLHSYDMLLKCIPYIHLLSDKKREFLMQSVGGKILERLEDLFDEDYGSHEMEEKDIPFLFELKSIITSIWNKGYECQYTLKCIDKLILSLLKSFDESRYEFIKLFFLNLEYPYTEQNLKKCKNKIIKENHPDNGGSGEYIQMIKSIYELFLSYIS